MIAESIHAQPDAGVVLYGRLVPPIGHLTAVVRHGWQRSHPYRWLELHDGYGSQPKWILRPYVARGGWLCDMVLYHRSHRPPGGYHVQRRLEWGCAWDEGDDTIGALLIHVQN